MDPRKGLLCATPKSGWRYLTPTLGLLHRVMGLSTHGALAAATYVVHAGILRILGLKGAMMQRHLDLGEGAPRRNWKPVMPLLPGVMLILWALIRSF